MRTKWVVLTSLMLAVPVGASVYGDFTKVWDARDKSYRSERPALESNAQQSAERAVNALVSDDPDAPQDLVLALNAAWSLSELAGRGQMLFTFREHMAGKPSAALSEVWIQGKVDELRRRKSDADMIEREMDMLKGHDSISVKQWIAALERLSMMRGTLAGEASELALINENLITYYHARSEEVSRNRAILSAALAGLAAAAQDSQENTRRRSATCVRTGQCARE
jgi:hypothetical protein